MRCSLDEKLPLTVTGCGIRSQYTIKTIHTITKLVMVLLVIMGLVLVLMDTVMDPVGLYWSPSIGGLLKPIHPNGIFPKTHYRKPFLLVKM